MAANPRRTMDEHHEHLRDYYEDTWFDYRFLWLDKHTRALHFGYEQPGERKHDASLLALNHVMAEHVRLRRGEHVLDAGCGVGGTSMWLAEEYDAEVIGVNLVEDHIERARRYGRERHLGAQVRFEVADYTATGLDESSFDVAWAQESACHAPDKKAFTSEMARVLRPGGRIVMAEYVVAADRSADPDDDAIADWELGWEMTLATQAVWQRGPRGGRLRRHRVRRHHATDAAIAATTRSDVPPAPTDRQRAAPGEHPLRCTATQHRRLAGDVAGARAGRLVLRHHHRPAR